MSSPACSAVRPNDTICAVTAARPMAPAMEPMVLRLVFSRCTPPTDDSAAGPVPFSVRLRAWTSPWPDVWALTLRIASMLKAIISSSSLLPRESLEG